jgi:hypothetical protein
MVTRFPRRYVTYHFQAPGSRKGGGEQAQAAKNKHKVYFFFDRANNITGKRYNSITGNTVFMTTPDIFYGNRELERVLNRRHIPRQLTANQQRNLRQRLINTVGGNARIAKVLITNGLNARRRELEFINRSRSIPPRIKVTHRIELAKYRAWNSILGNVPNLPTRNTTGLQDRRTLNHNFKLNATLYARILEHAHASGGNKNLTVGPVKNIQRQLFNKGVSQAKLNAQMVTTRRASSALNRQVPGTPAFNRALLNFQGQLTKANVMTRVLHGPKFNSSRT